MSRRPGSKNKNGSFYSVSRLQAKSKKLAESIDNYIKVSWSNQSFNKLVSYEKLNELKKHLEDIATLPT